MAGILVLYVSIRPNQKVKVSLINSESVKQAVPPSPTPTPVIIDQNSNLKLEVEKLGPDDFSGDFKLLQEVITNF